MRLFFCAIVALLVGCSHGGDATSATTDAGDESALDAASLPLDDFVRYEMDQAHIPGLAAVIVKHGKVVWSGYYGFADLASKRPVQADTIFTLASISKAFTAVAVMQLVEQGKLALDDDIDAHLPFTLRNPSHADVPITVRMLLSHVAGIDENPLALYGVFTDGDSPVSMTDFMNDWILPGGKHYDPMVWGSEAPGTKYSYSQASPTAAAIALEQITGEKFDAYTDEHLLSPLGVKDTSWRLSDLDASRVATPYTYFSTGEQRPNAPWGCPFYPAATMHSTAEQLAKYMISFIRTPDVDPSTPRLISAATQDEMLKVQYPSANSSAALLWDWRTLDDGSRITGHTGGAPGVSTTFFFRPSDGVGVITLTNSDVHIRIVEDRDAQVASYRAIEARLFRESSSY